MTDAARLWLTVLMALWVMAFGYSVVAFATLEPTGDGFTRGANRVMAFLGWQAVAGLISLPVWWLSRRWPCRSGVRRIGAVPILLALLLLAGLVGVILWSRMAG